MNKYIVSYDLLKPGKDYKAIIKAIEDLGGKRALLSQWIIKSNSTAVAIRDHLRQFIDSNDRLLVNGIGNGTWASWNLLVDPNTF